MKYIYKIVLFWGDLLCYYESKIIKCLEEIAFLIIIGIFFV